MIMSKFPILNSKNNIFVAKKTKIICFIACILLLNNLQAQESGGGYAGSWLFRNECARPIALAGGFTAISNDPSAIIYNPAGLSNLHYEPQIISSVSMLGLGRTGATLAWAQQIYDNLGVGVAFNNLYTGTFTARDQLGHAYGEYSNYQYAIAAAASYKIAYASFGATAKYLTNNLQGSETFANGFAVDFGAMFDIFDMFNFGITLQNASGMMFWNTVNSDIMTIPWRIKAGVATRFGLNAEVYTDRSTATGELEEIYVPATRSILIGLDASFTQFAMSPTFTFATEIVAHELITFRGGIAIYGEKWGRPQLFPMNLWGAGVSVYPELSAIVEELPFSFSIDYSVTNDLLNSNGISHHISLSVDF